MSYDKWKLATPDYSELVTSCCGVEVETKESLAYDDKIEYCSCCGDTDIEAIEQYEYDERRREDAAEFNRDDI
jgi:hypothetical protein